MFFSLKHQMLFTIEKKKKKKKKTQKDERFLSVFIQNQFKFRPTKLFLILNTV